MEVILLERINRLGAMGDVVKVKDGFARNFLIPQKKALRASNENRKFFDAKRADIEARNAESRAKAQEYAVSMENLSLTLTRQASEEGKLFGSVTVRDVTEALEANGHRIQKSQIQMPGSVKSTGAYIVKVQLHADVTVPVTLNVMRNEEAA